MLFKPELAQKILAGQKTQTRRMVKDGHNGTTLYGNTDFYEQVFDESHQDNNGFFRTVYAIGQTYAISPGRGKFQVGRIKITALHMEAVEDITEEDARREGFQDRAEFLAVFKKINPKSKPRDKVWVIDFEAVGQ